MPSRSLVRAADSLPVDAEQLRRRGQMVKRRREAHGIRSLRQMAERTGIARATLTLVEAGGGTEGSLVRVEDFLDSLDAVTGHDTRNLPVSLLKEDPDEGGELIEFDITGPTTKWHVVVRGPADIADEVRRQAAELLRDMDRTE